MINPTNYAEGIPSGRIDTNLRMQQGVKKLGLLFLVFFTHHFVYPQLLEVPLNNGAELTFSKKFVAANKIKTIKASVASKADNDVVVEMGITQGYEFDSLGNSLRIYSAYANNNNTFDTVATRIFYDKNFNVILKRSNSGVFYDAHYYEYYDTKKLKKETHCRETNSNLNGSQFKLGVQLILSQETFTYDSLTATQAKKIYLNDEGRVYKQDIINTDSSGKILEENYSFAVGWVKIADRYKYDRSGKLIERTNQSNENGDVKENTTYSYDNLGNVITEKRYKNGTQTHEISYLYDEQKKILKSLVTRYYLKKSIGIVKYSYEFFTQ